jgi:hypothetical protein
MPLGEKDDRPLVFTYDIQEGSNQINLLNWHGRKEIQSVKLVSDKAHSGTFLFIKKPRTTTDNEQAKSRFKQHLIQFENQKEVDVCDCNTLFIAYLDSLIKLDLVVDTLEKDYQGQLIITRDPTVQYSVTCNLQ